MSRGQIAMVLVATLVAVVPATKSPAAAAPDPYCSHAGEPGLVTYRWTGAVSTKWTDKGNWTRNGLALTAGQIVPGGRGNEQPFEPQPGTPVNTSRTTDYVCIPVGKTVVLDDDPNGDTWNYRIQALDVAGTAAQPTTLTTEIGTNLRVFGSQAARPSVVRSGATVFLNGGLGGPGRIDLYGTLRAGATESDSSGFFTRRCAGELTACQAAPSVKGLLVVANTGRLLVDGADGVNLLDYYQVRVHGLVRTTNQGYLAADHGTRFELQPKTDSVAGVGTLEFRNDGGYYEGSTPPAAPGLSQLVNNGRIVKAAGSGTSVISASYTATASSITEVSAGTLVLPDGAVRPALVAGGRRYGTARCVYTGSYVCNPVTTPGGDKQAATFRVPAADTNGAAVTVAEFTGSDPLLPAGVVGKPVTLHATQLNATAAAPAVVELRYDGSILAGQTPMTMEIRRLPTGGSSYQLVPTCLGNGQPPTAGAIACVDRRGITGVSSRPAPDDATDLIMVIRTRATSRWVGR